MSKIDPERAVLVCMKSGPSPFDDNAETNCEICGCDVMHRPHEDFIPMMKMCSECAKVIAVAMSKAGEPPEVVVHPKSKEDFIRIHGEEAWKRVHALTQKFVSDEDDD